MGIFTKQLPEKLFTRSTSKCCLPVSWLPWQLQLWHYSQCQPLTASLHGDALLAPLTLQSHHRVGGTTHTHGDALLAPLQSHHRGGGTTHTHGDALLAPLGLSAKPN